MSATLLSAVNGVLKRVKMIQGDAGALSSLTDSARQNAIDVVVKGWNDAIRELYTISRVAIPTEYVEDTVTLVTGTREYDLATDLEQLRYPFIDQTNGREVFEYPGGYEAMRADQLIPANFTGMPLYACINPSNGKIRFDRVPTASENGLVYNYGYDKRTSLSAAADPFPFSDSVVDALEIAVAELYNRALREKFDAGMFGASLGQAARLMSKAPQRARW